MSVGFFRPSTYWGAVLLLVVSFGLSGCGQQAPLRIGFVADLTGKQAELGVQERNGAQLAIEHINAHGGISGRPVELRIQDDFGNADGARQADRQLIADGAVAIIGHATSAQTIAGLEITEPANRILLSPTASSPDLSGKYANFFRVYPSFLDSARSFAVYIRNQRNLPSLAVLYDTDNAAYAKTYRDVFVTQYTAAGGTICREIPFSSGSQPDFAPLLQSLRQDAPAGLLLIASDIDVALLAQRTRLQNWKVPLFISAWAQTETLLHNGGQAIEGAEIEQAYPLDNNNPAFAAFAQQYRERFGRPPSFGAFFAYESAAVLCNALKKTSGKQDGLRQALLETRNFPGLTDPISFNANGDVIRPFYLSAIRNGKFVILTTLAPLP